MHCKHFFESSTNELGCTLGACFDSYVTVSVESARHLVDCLHVQSQDRLFWQKKSL